MGEKERSLAKNDTARYGNHTKNKKNQKSKSPHARPEKENTHQISKSNDTSKINTTSNNEQTVMSS